MSIYIFAGPSLTEVDRQWVDTFGTLLPPVAAEDLLRLEVKPNDRVGIIDGFFHRRPAVRHKEILYLISQQVRVHGAASMGALRAAELAACGMIGHGRIFRDYRDGVIMADDEVAVLHGMEGECWETYTEALVSVRYAIDELVKSEIVPDWLAKKALSSFRQIPFSDRTRENLIEIARQEGFDDELCATLDSCIHEAPDYKNMDAVELLKAIQLPEKDDLPASSPAPPRTIFLNNWISRSRGFCNPSLGWIADWQIHDMVRIVSRNYPEFRERVAERILRDEDFDPKSWDESLDVWCTSKEMSFPEDFRRVKGATRAFFRDTSLDIANPFFEALKEDSEAYRQIEDCFMKFLQFRARIVKLRADYLEFQIPFESVSSFYGALWGASDIADVALERGFDGIDEFAESARRYYLFQKAHPDLEIML